MGKLTIALLLLLTVISAFGGGYGLRGVMETNVGEVNMRTTPGVVTIPTLTPIPELRYSLGKRLFDDGFYLLANDPDKTALVVSVGRLEEELGNFVQRSRVSRIQATRKTRKTAELRGSNHNIANDGLIRKWYTTQDETRMLKERSQIELDVDGDILVIDTGLLTNEMVNRSWPGYTKIFSNGSGKITINGKMYDANILYYRLYSQNSSEVMVYQNNLGIKTDLGVLWNEKGEAYLIDATEVKNPSTTYVPHKIAFMSSGIQGEVFRTFDLSVKRDDQIPPDNYEFKIGNPILVDIRLKRTFFLNKSGGEALNWFLSEVEGVVKRNGSEQSVRGIMEYIDD